MSACIAKTFLHPLFRFFFWLAASVWLVVMGIFDSGWFRWIDFIVAFILFGSVIENAVKSVLYFRKHQSSSIKSE